MYTEAELEAIRAAERRLDMERDAAHQSQYAEYQKEREAAIEAQRKQLNPDLAKRLAAIRQRMEGDKP